MTPDALHYVLLIPSSVALAALVVAVLVMHLRVRSRWSLTLLAGLVAVVSGQALQLFSPIDALEYDKFRGIVVSSGERPFEWYAGSLISSLGLLVAAAGALGLAFTAPRSGS